MKASLRLAVSLIALICFLFVFSSCTGQAPSELPPSSPTESPNITEARETLQSISADLTTMYDQFGIDESVAEYITFAASLPEEFASYALTNKLCIQDRQLTELEKQFLEEPDQYLQQMFDSYMTEVSTIDPDLATQLNKLPYFRTLEIEDVEAVEDILWLAGDPRYKSKLEKIYGKDIERNMWPVALERVVYKALDNEFDTNNPLESSEWYVNSRLAEFQEKYNQQMDEAEPVEGTKPQIVGVNYVYEPMGWLYKSDDDIRFDYALMRWVLGANAVKIWGRNPLAYDVAFDHVELAHEEGLEVWLEFCPVYQLETTDPDISVESYCEQLAGFAQEAERLEVEVLIVGHEVDLHLKRFSNETGELKTAVEEMLETARQNYSGPVTYCTWSDPWGLTDVNWELVDIVFPQLYKSDCTRELTDNEYLDALIQWKSRIPQKPLAISEYGSLTVSDAGAIGPCWYIPLEQPVRHDPQAQADFIERQLRVLFEADIYGMFLHCWEEKDNTGVYYDQNTLGFGIWDYKSQEPKPSFWAVYKYYRER